MYGIKEGWMLFKKVLREIVRVLAKGNYLLDWRKCFYFFL